MLLTFNRNYLFSEYWINREWNQITITRVGICIKNICEIKLICGFTIKRFHETLESPHIGNSKYCTVAQALIHITSKTHALVCVCACVHHVRHKTRRTRPSTVSARCARQSDARDDGEDTLTPALIYISLSLSFSAASVMGIKCST